jgi:hypothetical protein
MRRTRGLSNHVGGRRAAVAMLFCAGVAASPARAQGVFLRVHPRQGDTLRTRLDQQTEVSGTLRGTAGPTARSVTTSVRLDSRTIVQASLATSTVVLTIVDSVDIHTTDEHAATLVAEAERRLRGQQLVLRLALDGTVESASDARGMAVSRAVAEAMAAMPAIFPHRALGVGDEWVREMPLPAGGPLGTKGSGRVSATFRLDSLDRSGNMAYLSMRGEVKPDSGSDEVKLTGTITGAMQVDRARGWMTDSRVTVLLRSLVTPPARSGLAPMRFVTRVTQRLRTMDKR